MNKKWLILPVLVISGCTSVWEPKSGISRYTLQESESICSAESNKVFPVKNEVAQRSVLKDIEVKCKKNDDCGSDKTYKDKVSVTESYVLDVNEDSRTRFYDNCMNNNGWQKKDKYIWE